MRQRIVPFPPHMNCASNFVKFMLLIWKDLITSNLMWTSTLSWPE